MIINGVRDYFSPKKGIIVKCVVYKKRMWSFIRDKKNEKIIKIVASASFALGLVGAIGFYTYKSYYVVKPGIAWQYKVGIPGIALIIASGLFKMSARAKSPRTSDKTSSNAPDPVSSKPPSRLKRLGRWIKNNL